MEDNRSMQQLAREVLSIQEASNLLGVANGFARAMTRLFQLTRSHEKTRAHPITWMWVNKIADMMSLGTHDLDDFGKYGTISRVVLVLAEGKPVPEGWESIEA